MTIEAKLDALASAVEANTAAVLAQNELVAKALKASGGKPATTAATGGKGTSGKTDKAPKTPTVEDVRAVWGPYLAAGKDKDAKKRLIATTKPLLAHFGVDKITEVAEESRAEAIGYGKDLMAAFEDGGVEAAEAVKFDFMGDGEGEDEEEESPL